jgi:hypothetical protein
MNTGGEAADEMVKYYFEAIKCAATITGKGAEHALGILLNEMKNHKQTKGKARLNSMLKSGKPLKIFTMQKKDLVKFTREAKSYGVLYCALVNRKNKNFDDMVDILVRQEDASKVDRIVERFKLTTSNPAYIKTEIQKEMSDIEENNIGVQTKTKEDLEQDIVFKKPLQAENINTSNFNMAKTETSRPLEPYSKTSREANNESRKSVRKELQEIKEEKKDLKSKDKTVTKTKNKDKTK